MVGRMARGVFVAVGLALMAGYPVAFTLAGIALLVAAIGTLPWPVEQLFRRHSSCPIPLRHR